MNTINVKGAREHNLQNVSLVLPKNQLIVMTGVSGSGKSSLAFDTIYAEGQRRYVESLSAYARQFLGIMDKPDVDAIEGLSPSISIDQKTASRNPRSTVGTVTEIYDYLRLLFARVGHPHCPNCGREISKLSVEEITLAIINLCQHGKFSVGFLGKAPVALQVIAPVVRQKKGEFKELFDNLKSKGFVRFEVDGKKIDNLEKISLIKTNRHDIFVIIDEIFLTKKDLRDEVFLANLKTRIRAAVELSINLCDGLVLVKTKNEEHLFSEKFSCPMCNLSLPELEPRMFSFNSPLGACEKCHGLGFEYRVDPALILNYNLSVNEGGIKPFNKFFFSDTWQTRFLRRVAEVEKLNFNLPLGQWSKDKIELLLNGTGKKYQVWGFNRFNQRTVIEDQFNGIVSMLEKRVFESANGEEAFGFEIQRYLKEEICGLCHGAKLKPEYLAVTVGQKNISQISNQCVTDLLQWENTALSSFEQQIASPIFKEIKTRLNFLKNVGLGYLTLSRTARSLSGGELQRIRLASQIGTGLTGVLYVLDEPSIGLHQKDVLALIKTLNSLRDLGNTLIVVEHDQEIIEAADQIVELGPAAGKQGGKLVFQGTLTEIKKNKQSLTGAYLSGRKKVAEGIFNHKLETSLGWLILKGAKLHNLKNIEVRFPLGNLIAVTGVSGSGKSTLISETLYPALKYYLEGHAGGKFGFFELLDGYQNLKKVYLVDQSPIGRTPRSNPATYIGFFDEIRDIFASMPLAHAKGFKKGRFSFNVKGGRCEKCQGAGVIKIEMQFLSDVYVTCDLCHGRRYNEETLEVLYKSKNIAEILQMTVDEAADFFASQAKIKDQLTLLKKVGLGYIQLGQGAPTFSGGEAQRMKLVNELAKKEAGGNFYILDEPTTGLHFNDVRQLLSVLRELVGRGNTVVVIEHNLDVIRAASYIVDMGPDGGNAGGEVVYQGEIADIVKCKQSYTGEYLKRAVATQD